MKKISNHCYTTGKFRRATHWIYNVNLKITKKVFLGLKYFMVEKVMTVT